MITGGTARSLLFALARAVARYRLAVPAPFCAMACSSAPVAAEPPGCTPPTFAPSGTFAPDPSLNAVGSLGTLSGTAFTPFCTAVLVANTSILTAKHCTEQPIVWSASGAIFFGIGADTSHLDAIVPVVMFETMPVEDGGGYTGYASDVAVGRLGEPVEHVTPLVISDESLDSGDAGEELTVVGYAPGDDGSAAGSPGGVLRRQGRQTVRAVGGNLFDGIYGGRDGFLRGARADDDLSGSTCSAVDRSQASLEATYDAGQLVAGYEIWAGGSAGDVQTCHGDSGGPLLRAVGASMQIVALASWSWRSTSFVCSYGTVYASLGASVRAWISASGIDGGLAAD